jgi:hypothetical protein
MRRLSLVSLVLIGTALHAQKPAVTIDVDPLFASQGVAVTPFYAPDFQSVLERLMPLDAIAALTRLHSYILPVRNGVDQAIKLVVIRYPQVDTGGYTIESQIEYKLEGRREFPPGATFIFTPDEQLTDVLIGNALDGNTQDPALARFCIIRRDAVFRDRLNSRRYPESGVSLDSVTLKDGSVIGPDRADIVGRESRKRQIEASLLQEMMDQTLSDVSLAALLDEHVQQWIATQPMDPRTRTFDVAATYHYHLARMLGRSLRKYGRVQAIEGLKKFAEDRAAIPPPHRAPDRDSSGERRTQPDGF